MNISNTLLNNENIYAIYPLYPTASYHTPVRLDLSDFSADFFATEGEKTVAKFTPLLTGEGVRYVFSIYFTSQARWQATVNVYENDNISPIATITTELPSSASVNVSGNISFDVNAFSTYTITIDIGRVATVRSTNNNYIDYGVGIKNDFSIIEEV